MDAMSAAIVWLVVWLVCGLVGTAALWVGVVLSAGSGLMKTFDEKKGAEGSWLFAAAFVIADVVWTIFWVVQVILQILSIVELATA